MRIGFKKKIWYKNSCVFSRLVEVGQRHQTLVVGLVSCLVWRSGVGIGLVGFEFQFETLASLVLLMKVSSTKKIPH